MTISQAIYTFVYPFIISIGVFFVCHTFLLKIRPKIEISDKIAAGEDRDTKRPIYRIKIINKNGKLLKVEGRLLLMRREHDKDYVIEEIPLRRSEISFLSKSGQMENGHTYCHNISTHEDLKSKLLNDAFYLRIEVLATHPFSKAMQMFFRAYGRNSIERGIFRAGNTFDIVPE
jgi:hypothetical protein